MPEPAVAPPPQLQLPAPADPSGVGSMDIGTDEGALSQASQMANAQPQAPAQPPATPLHSRIADGVLSAFSKSDGTAGGFLRSALAGGLAGLAAASNRPPGNVPRGAAALGGFGTGATAAFQQANQQQQQKLENQRQQTAQQMEKTRQDYLNAETQARTVADQKTANKLDEEDMATRVKSGQAAASAYSNHREPLGQGLTAEEIYPEAGEGGKYDHSKVTAFQTGTKEVLENGQTHTVPTFSIYPRSAEQVTVTPELSSVLKEGGYDYKEGTKIDGDLLDSLTTKSMAAQTSKALLSKAMADAKMSQDAIDAATASGADLALVNPQLGHFSGDRLTAMEMLAQQKDPKTGQLTAAAQAAGRIVSKMDQKELETHRHDVAEEKNKAEENRLKAASSDPAAWNLNGPAAANLTGPAYLKTLSQPMAAALTEAAEGRGKPVMMQNRKGELTPMGEAMMKAYPDYDIAKGEEYPKLVREFVTGQTSKDLVAMGTAINHTRAAYDNTGPESYIPGTKENNRYNQDVGYISEELGKYVKGGVATGGEVDKILDGIKSRNPAVRKSALENAATIIEGRRTELEQKWKNGQVRPSYQPPMPSISPTAEANFDYLKNGGPKMGATKTFPNGAVGVWDGHGYVAQPKANP